MHDASHRTPTATRLRLYRGPDDIEDCTLSFVGPSSSTTMSPQPAVVTLRLRDVLPTLMEAVKGNYLWVEDFLDDEIKITEDFYQVLRAFEEMRGFNQEVC